MPENKNRKPTRTLIIAMLVLVAIGITTAKVYYSGINKSVDPRILPARMAYISYNQKAQLSDYTGVLSVLDSITSFYKDVPHYENSFEIGVAHINRAATYMTVGLHIDSLRISSQLGFMKNLTKKGLLDLAEEELNIGIQMYQNWQNKFGSLDSELLESEVRKTFFMGLESYSEKEKDQFLVARLKDLETAQWENERRLSVAYTNLGIIHFHRDDFTTAADYFNKALELWEDNLNAENNLNSMLGKPLTKRNFIQKMFPKERGG